MILWAPGAFADPALTFQRSLSLRGDDPTFGGLSAIETRDAGRSFDVLSDRGAAFTITVDRAARSVDVTPATQPAPDHDSEGLAWTERRMFYSYEGPATVRRENGKALPRHPDFRRFPPNSSLEALAAAPDGTLYTIPERSGGESRPFPIYRFKSGQWDILRTLARDGNFLPAGADLGPDGALYVLERALGPLGFRTRIRLVDLGTNTPARTLLTTPPGRHGNLEGIAVWTSASGATCLTMVSDDNFLPVQRSELVEYAVTETLAGDARCD